MDQIITHLPGEALPDGAPEPKLTQTQHVEVYGLGSLRAVVVIETKNDKHVVKSAWLSSQDSNLASQLLSAIQERYIIPNKGLLFIVSASQPALMEVLKPFPLRSQIMSKQIDPNVKLPENISYRDMTAEESHVYRQKMEEWFMTEMLNSKSENEDEKDVRQRVLAMFNSISPNGDETPGQKYLIVEDAGTPVSTLWVGARGNQSFCYNIEVESEKRNLGYGRKTLLVWEHASASLGLVGLGLNVFGKNTTALKLYSGGGFAVQEATIILDDRKQGI